MKRILFCLFSTLCAVSLLAQQVSIKGKITKYSGADSVTLEIYTQQIPVVKKVPVTKKGDFFYNYTAEATHFVNVYLSRNDAVTIAVAPDDKISLEGEYRRFSATCEVKGSQQAQEMQAVSQKLLNYQQQAQQATKRYEALIDSLDKEVKLTVLNALMQNPSNYGNLILCGSLPIESFPDVYQILDSALMEAYPGDFMVLNFHAEVMKQLLLRPGTKIGEISLPNQKLEDVRLSSLRGKVVLIDFWASWCRPCRMEIPNFKKMYDAYHDRGFEIYSISVDNDASAWVKALSQEQMPWANVRDINKQYSNMFNVQAIPFTILIDAEGKIVAKGLRGAELSDKINEILK